MSGSAAKVDAWMPLWIGDLLAETMGLTRDQIGGYMLLLFAYWRNKGPLPDDDESFAAIVRATADDWRARLRPRLAPFFMLQASAWHHERTELELAKAGRNKAVAVEKARKAAEGRWRPKDTSSNASGNAPSIPGAVVEGCLVDTPSPSPSPSPMVSSSLRSEEKGVSDQSASDTSPTRTGSEASIDMADYNLPLPEWLQSHGAAWRAFQEIRRKKNAKSPYTRAAQKGILRELEGFHRDGHDLTTILTTSVTNGWAGVFAPRAVRPRVSVGGFSGRDYNGGDLERDFGN